MTKSMREQRGCYWCKHREELECPFARYELKSVLEMSKLPVEVETLKTERIGSKCPYFKYGLKKEKVVFT